MEKICPVCKKSYTQYPATARFDDKTEICPDCGVEEAMIDCGLAELTPDWIRFMKEVENNASNN